eukprot:COSAG01_NODE_17170_length_1173_cov_1.195531_1_plen_44_part_10
MQIAWTKQVGNRSDTQWCRLPVVLQFSTLFHYAAAAGRTGPSFP